MVAGTVDLRYRTTHGNTQSGSSPKYRWWAGFLLARLRPIRTLRIPADFYLAHLQARAKLWLVEVV